MFKTSGLVLIAFITAVLSLVPNSALAAGNKISASPSSAALAPGQSVVANFSLDQPVICPTTPCEVTLDFSNSETLGLTASPATITWPDNQWMQTRTVTFTLGANTIATHPQTVDMQATAQSASAYYQGFTVSFPIDLVVPDIRPVVAPDSEELAVTGYENSDLGVFSVVVVLCGVVFVARDVRRKRNS